MVEDIDKTPYHLNQYTKNGYFTDDFLRFWTSAAYFHTDSFPAMYPGAKPYILRRNQTWLSEHQDQLCEFVVIVRNDLQMYVSVSQGVAY